MVIKVYDWTAWLLKWSRRVPTIKKVISFSSLSLHSSDNGEITFLEYLAANKEGLRLLKGTRAGWAGLIKKLYSNFFFCFNICLNYVPFGVCASFIIKHIAICNKM